MEGQSRLCRIRPSSPPAFRGGSPGPNADFHPYDQPCRTDPTAVVETEGVMDDSVRVLVVDAANVVGSRPDGWWRDRAGAARRLLARLSVLRAELPHLRELVVVVEGAAKAVRDNEFRNVRLVRATGSGDDAIVTVTAECGAPEYAVVVTADRGLRARIEALGARTIGPRWLLDRIDSIQAP